MTEIDLQRDILAAARAMGIELWRCQSGKVKVRGAWMQLAPAGTPDLIGYVRGGRMLAIEVKLPPYTRSKEQMRWAERAGAQGVAVYCVTSLAQAVACMREARG